MSELNKMGRLSPKHVKTINALTVLNGATLASTYAVLGAKYARKVKDMTNYDKNEKRKRPLTVAEVGGKDYSEALKRYANDPQYQKRIDNSVKKISKKKIAAVAGTAAVLTGAAIMAKPNMRNIKTIDGVFREIPSINPYPLIKL